MPLTVYRKKRKFDETPEPSGHVRRSPSRGGIFVIQKHDASQLHYDFRLEIGGGPVGWAVPKGPSLNPADKRLAMRTEDHPIEYGDFEGIIPEGHYGAGTVMIWDTGEYETVDGATPKEALERGEIKFALHGKKLQGEFVLVRLKNRPGQKSQRESWLLIKHRDENVDPA